MAIIRGPLAQAGRFKYLLLALVVLVISDGIITNFLIQGETAREGNPFLLTIVGGSEFLVIKTVGALLCAVILWDIHRHWRKLATVSSTIFVAIYAGIVIWNLSLFFLS